MVKMTLLVLVSLLVIFLLFFRYLLAPQVSKQWEFIDFKTLKLKDSPNQFLVCSKENCSADYHQKAEIYACSISALKQALSKAFAQLPDTKLLGEDIKKHQWVYVQYSKLWRFPDFIYVQFYELAPDRSTLAIYSYSQFGYSDFNVNQKRVQKILSLIKGC